MARLMVDLGVEKIRLTGGEPLLRAGLLDLIREVRGMRTAFNRDGVFTQDGGALDIALTDEEIGTLEAPYTPREPSGF